MGSEILGSLSKNTSTAERAPPENVTSRFCNHFSIIQVITLAKYVSSIQELNWNQRFRGHKTKLNFSHHMLASSTQLQVRSFHVVERTRTPAKLFSESWLL